MKSSEIDSRCSDGFHNESASTNQAKNSLDKCKISTNDGETTVTELRDNTTEVVFFEKFLEGEYDNDIVIEILDTVNTSNRDVSENIPAAMEVLEHSIEDKEVATKTNAILSDSPDAENIPATMEVSEHSIEDKGEVGTKTIRFDHTNDMTVINKDTTTDIVRFDNRLLSVPVSEDQKKRYYCNFCSKTITNFGRHLVTFHKDREEVVDLLKYPKGHPDRRYRIDCIRKQAQFEHNTLLEKNTGILIVRRRPSKNKLRTPVHYKICPNCKDLYSKLSLRVHFSKCTVKIKGKRDILIQSRQLQMNVHGKASKRLVKDILAYSRDDKITQAFLYDELCILYGNKLCQKYRNQQHNNMIRTKLRDLGKFILNMQAINKSVHNLKDILEPSNYDVIVEAINNTAGLDVITGKYKAPSTAYNLGLQLKAVTTLLQSECIKEKYIAKRDSLRDLLCLMNDGFSTDINKTVTENQSENRRHKKVVLPTAEDITALNNYLESGRKEAFNLLTNKFSHKAWKDLAGFTLISLQLFNRRRAGELERILIEDYVTYEFISQDNIALQGVHENIKHLAKYYARFSIRGKLNRQVPVIISQELISYIDIIIKYREAYGVSRYNPYVFGTPSKNQHMHLRACMLMRHYAKACGAPNPTTLRGTELRKQIATACGLYNLSEPLVQDVANHLGHHIDIHKKIYRQSLGRELPTVVQILLKALGEVEMHNNIWESPESDCNTELKDMIAVSNNSSENSSFHGKNNHVKILSDVKLSNTNKKSLDNLEISANKVKRTSWSTPERNAVRNSFGDYIQHGIVPTFDECNSCRSENSCLEKRTPPQIKSFVAYETRKLSAHLKSKGKKTWSSSEDIVVRSEFATYLNNRRLPSLKKCLEVINYSKVLKGRTPESLKSHIDNLNRKARAADP